MIRIAGSTFEWWGAACVLIITGLMISCHGGKKLTSGDAKGELSAESLYETLEARQPSYTWFNARGKIRAVTEDISVSAVIQLRMLKDSAIWIRAEKFGFEVGRSLITPDSAFVINRLTREYYAVELRKFMDEYNAPFDFDDLQRMLIVGTIELPAIRLKSEPVEEFIRLRINAEEYLGLYWFDQALLLDHSVLVDLDGRRVEVQYGDYQSVAGGGDIAFAKFLKLFDGHGTTELTLNFTDIELDVPKTMRFQIPANYERVD